jgi:hypothetical protein
MPVNPPAGRRDGGALLIAERVDAILRDEIANGALSNIVAAGQVWSAHRRDLVLPETTRRVAVELGGFLDAVLDLVAPPPGSAATTTIRPTVDRGSSEGGRGELAEPVPLPVLRARGSAPPGGTAEIRTALWNDGPTPIQSGFVWSDLVTGTDMRIEAGYLVLLPGRVRIPPGASAGLTIELRVPGDARPGLYHALLQATEPVRSSALLLFQIERDELQEASDTM